MSSIISLIEMTLPVSALVTSRASHSGALSGRALNATEKVFGSLTGGGDELGVGAQGHDAASR